MIRINLFEGSLKLCQRAYQLLLLSNFNTGFLRPGGWSNVHVVLITANLLIIIIDHEMGTCQTLPRSASPSSSWSSLLVARPGSDWGKNWHTAQTCQHQGFCIRKLLSNCRADPPQAKHIGKQCIPQKLVFLCRSPHLMNLLAHWMPASEERSTRAWQSAVSWSGLGRALNCSHLQ